uniref:Uncharacterized protein n=1 Tax=Stomoxys calcitrans TaxID=35570 RepID=A0A1I8PRM3_STOCA|nr:unnamed protein product [Stomoxys calcitrans]
MNVSSAYKVLVVRQCRSKISFSSLKGKHQNGHVKTSSSTLLNEAEDNTQSWNKSPFFEFIEKTIVRRMEYLLERTSYMEEMRKAKNNMMHVQEQRHERECEDAYNEANV